MSILEQIIETKRREIIAAQAKRPLDALKRQLEHPPRIEHRIIKTGQLQLIAEIKAKSPSKGLIRSDFEPLTLARDFTTRHATAISVLTDHEYFGGSLDIFRQVRTTTPLPLLRKDFIIDPYQVYETKAIGADIILLIARVIGPQLAELTALSISVGLQVLIEAHTEDELQFVLNAITYSPQIMIGINNRDLDTFVTDIQTGIELIKTIPPEFVRVAESGLNTVENLALMQRAGFDAALIGEGLARNPELFNYFSDYENH